MKTLFVVCQHGNEKLPLDVLNKYRGKIRYILANKRAFERNVRYVEVDMNRSFPGKLDGVLEERLAFRLKEKLSEYQTVIDLHTATCSTALFAIITKVTPAHIEVIKRLGIRRVVYMEESIASGGALIDHVKCGVSVECGFEKFEKTKKDIEAMVRSYIKNQSLEHEIDFYVVYKLLRPSANLEKLPIDVTNFRKTRIGGEEFYPVLARERNYKGVLCLMARKVSLEELKVLKLKA